MDPFPTDQENCLELLTKKAEKKRHKEFSLEKTKQNTFLKRYPLISSNRVQENSLKAKIFAY